MKATAPASVQVVYFEIGSHNLGVYPILNAFKEVSDTRRARTGQPSPETLSSGRVQTIWLPVRCGPTGRGRVEGPDFWVLQRHYLSMAPEAALINIYDNNRSHDERVSCSDRPAETYCPTLPTLKSILVSLSSSFWFFHTDALISFVLQLQNQS